MSLLLPSRWRTLAARLLAPLITAAAFIGPAQAGDDFLAPEQAFAQTAQVLDAGTVALRIEIAPGYHLYRERLSLAIEPAAAATLGDVTLPAGRRTFDANFGQEVETYTGTLTLRVPVRPAPGAAEPLRLVLNSQGCADAGLCYPPQQQAWRLDTEAGALRTATRLAGDAGSWTTQATAPAASADKALTQAPAAAADSPSRIDGALRSGSLWQVAGMFLLAGLLLSFTPCVLPMVPILSSIIVGQGAPVSRWKGLSLSLAYALGMALVYTAFGVAAGLAGEGLTATLQQPAVLGAFALLLVALSLSMFGLYELQLPNALQSRLSTASTRLQGGRHAGVFLMGGLSALIVGPCVAAPLAGALVFISQTRDVVVGGLALFSLAAGMSVPLLLVGLSAGSLLPRAGAWMEAVKRFFGFMLLAVALWMVSPVLPVWALMGLAGVLLLLAAAWLGLGAATAAGASGWQRSRAALALLLGLLGGAEIIGMLAGSASPLTPLAVLARAPLGNPAVASAAAPTTPFRRIRNVAELDAALRNSSTPVMLDFYADWCVSCKEMEHLTFADPQVRNALSKVQLLQVDVTANSDEDRALLKRFNLFGPPGIVFFDTQGRELPQARVIGYLKADDFAQRLRSLGS